MSLKLICCLEYCGISRELGCIRTMFLAIEQTALQSPAKPAIIPLSALLSSRRACRQGMQAGHVGRACRQGTISPVSLQPTADEAFVQTPKQPNICFLLPFPAISGWFGRREKGGAGGLAPAWPARPPGQSAPRAELARTRRCTLGEYGSRHWRSASTCDATMPSPSSMAAHE